jgi:murein DD-endopeptidase MepM/ murein hydrolase activator NlpD
MSKQLQHFIQSTVTVLQGWFGVRLEAFVKMNNTRIYHDNRFKFLGASIALALIMILAIPNKQEADANADILALPTVPLFDLSRYDLSLEEAPKHAQSEKTLTLKSGDSLGPLLQESGIEPNLAYQITQDMSQVYDPRKLRAGQSFYLYFDGDELDHLTFKPSIDRTIFLSRQSDGQFTAKDIAAEFKMDLVSAKGKIEYSLFMDANRMGAPDKVIQQFANIYEYSVDFQRDIQPGDEFEMFFEIARDKQGNIVKAGDLLFTSFSPRKKTMEYYLYKDAKGRENFYDKTGKTAKRKLRATPVSGARISSRFGKRRHPISGFRKMHTGVDFAAPTGTPIMAAGTGVVEFAGRNGGYGKYIRIRHSDGYKTAYAHMSRYAVRKGARVRQDQVIGYVGSTGASTGPHLHYEVILNGRKINPRRLSQLSGKPLAKSAMPAFEKRRAEIDAMRSGSELLSKAPQVEVLTAEKID